MAVVAAAAATQGFFQSVKFWIAYRQLFNVLQFI